MCFYQQKLPPKFLKKGGKCKEGKINHSQNLRDKRTRGGETIVRVKLYKFMGRKKNWWMVSLHFFYGRKNYPVPREKFGTEWVGCKPLCLQGSGEGTMQNMKIKYEKCEQEIFTSTTM